MNRITLFATAAALALSWSAAGRCADKPNAGSLSDTMLAVPSPIGNVEARTFVVWGDDGKAIFTIDGKARSIHVPADVKVNQTARAVINAMRLYLLEMRK
jgi:hypothetical protein